MQLFAYDKDLRLIAANQALRQHDYFCLECRKVVHKRGGIHRQDHFYHIEPVRSCRQNGKSLTHLQIQLTIQQLLTEKQAAMEYRFEKIGRIADVAWLSQKIVFEIQCSPITAEEVVSRNRDYASIGYQVIWVLHDTRFNQQKLTAAELILFDLPHYFTNIDDDGKGIIYDQYAVISKGMRYQTFSPMPINVIKRKAIPHYLKNVKLPALLNNRAKKHSHYFEEDLIDHYLTHGLSPDMLKALKAERSMKQEVSRHPFSHFIQKWIVRPYFLLFQICLERACK